MQSTHNTSTRSLYVISSRFELPFTVSGVFTHQPQTEILDKTTDTHIVDLSNTERHRSQWKLTMQMEDLVRVVVDLPCLWVGQR